MGNTFLIHQLWIEDQVAVFRNFAHLAHTRMKSIDQIEIIGRYTGRTKNDVAALTECGQRFLKLNLKISGFRKPAFIHTQKPAMIRILGDFFNQFRSSWQPATVTVIVILIKVFGDVLNKPVDGG